MTLRERTAPLRRSLAGLRSRVRSLTLVLGSSRTLMCIGAAVLALFLADFLLRPPVWMRGALLVALVIGTGLILLRYLVHPMMTPLPDSLLAARVEAAHPELEDRLRSSLAFSDAIDDPDNEDSPELMRVVVDETVTRVTPLRFGEVARGGVAVPWALGAAVLLAGLAFSAFSRPDLATTFARRSLLLQDVAWPRRTTLTVVGMTPDDPRRVTLGRETTLQIRADGWIPDRVHLSFWESGANRRNARRVELTPAAEDPNLFAFTLRVLSSYEFTVSGGDDDRRLTYGIEALTPPSILKIEMDARYPEYLGRPPETLSGGGQRVPQGTELTLRLKTNMDLRDASIAVGTAEPEPLEPQGDRTYAASLVAAKDVRYSVRLVGTNGEENDPGIDTFFLRVSRDQAPTLRVYTPASRTQRLTGGVALVALTARDDHKVTSVRFHYRTNDDTERVVAVGEAGGDALRFLTVPERTDDYVPGVIALDFARLRKDDGNLVAKGDRVTYWFTAKDSAGHERRSRIDQRVDLVTEEELSLTIQSRQQVLRDAVRRADNRSRDATDYLKFVEDAREDEDEFRRWTGRAQAAQARVIDDLESVVRRIRSLLNVYVFNRLGDRSTAEQMLPYYERHLLEPLDWTGAPFRGHLYRELWSALAERRIRAGGTYAKLIEMADLADRLAAEHSPKAYRALGRVGAAQSDADVDEALQTANAEQRAIVDGIAKLTRLMREWEDFEGVVRWFKRLREDEKAIVDDLKDLEDKRK